MPNDAAAEKPGSAENGNGAIVHVAEPQIRQLTPKLSRSWASGHVNGMPTRRYP